MGKPILCLDFDGVLHSYVSGWQGATDIPDPPVAGAMEFLAGAVERFAVAIHSSRSRDTGGIEAMQAWTLQHLKAALGDGPGTRVYVHLNWPTEKPSAFVTLDDRAVTFMGVWPSLDELAAFKPWHKPA